MLTLAVLINLIWWVYCAVTFEGFEHILNKYLSVFPKSLASGRLIAYLSLFLMTLNIIILIYFLNRRFYLSLAVTLLSVNGLVFMWTLFSLM